MAATAQKILEDLRELSPEERLRVVEQVVHEVAVEVKAQHAPAQTAIWAEESESDFQAFQSALARLRSTDTWRTGDEPNPA
jgi:ribonuclease HII